MSVNRKSPDFLSLPIPKQRDGFEPETVVPAKTRLRSAGLRPTSQRCAIANLLFAGKARHVDANTLYSELKEIGENVSLATVYNTLNDFEDAGLIRRIAAPRDKAWFDTDTGDHSHFYIAEEDLVVDCPGQGLEKHVDVPVPTGYRVERVDVVIHLVKLH